MAIINLDVFCSFRFIEFENGSHYTVCTDLHKTSLQYSCIVHKTSLQNSCTKNWFTVQVYLKPVYSTDIHNTAFSSILSFQSWLSQKSEAY